MDKQFDLCLYAVTDRGWLGEKALEEQVEAAIRGGVTMIQLREKAISTREFLMAAEAVKRVTDAHDVPLVINDRLDIALAVDADGLHVGQDDLPAATARRLLGPGKILGVSVADREEAIIAARDGADYIGAGAVFPTGTKTDVADVSPEELKAIVTAVRIPVVAIGGINGSNAMRLQGSGIRGIAVISAIFARPDVQAAAEQMRKAAEAVVEEAAR